MDGGVAKGKGIKVCDLQNLAFSKVIPFFENSTLSQIFGIDEAYSFRAVVLSPDFSNMRDPLEQFLAAVAASPETIELIIKSAFFGNFCVLMPFVYAKSCRKDDTELSLGAGSAFVTATSKFCTKILNRRMNTSHF